MSGWSRTRCLTSFCAHLRSYIPHVVPLVAPRWLDSIFTLLIASVLLFMGARHLFIDARSGVRWWGSEFWCAPLPPVEKEPLGGEGAPLKAAAT